MDDILYKNSTTDIRIREMVNVLSNTDKELPNLIILTILSAGAGVGTPIFNKEPSEIGTKFILDDKEITSDDFLVVSISNSGGSYNFFGLLFEDANPHILKISLINPSISNFQQITKGRLGCSANSITSAIISSSITEIEEYAFTMCSNLTSVTIGNSVASIGHHAFSGCTGLTSVTIPNSVTSIGASAFSGCSGLTSVTIPNSVTVIGNGAFERCGNLTSVTIPNSVTSIGDYAFSFCIGLTSVTIPNSVKSIGDYAFDECSGLTSITSLATTAPTILSSTFQNIKTNGTLHVPAGSDYSAWMSTNNYYLGKYNWTKVEDA